ncbi:MAG TPA: hypothetical protein VHQ47_02285 [Phycisphaerae bacterium]|nr:hypothetical protein [Phycisphaerae bacterium]
MPQACTGPQTHASKPAASRPASNPDLTLHASRRQSLYTRLNLPVITPGTQISIAPADGPAPLASTIISAFSARITRGSVTGPLVDQLTGNPALQADTGSYLVPVPTADAKSIRTFTLAEPMPVYLKLTVSPAQDPGDYDFQITIRPPVGKGKLGPPTTTVLRLSIADIALPTEPRVLAVATTTTTDLARIFPTSFGQINAIYLNRDDADNRPAVAQFDTLMKAAEQEGVALFVEDITPRVRVDDVGRVFIDWDAYDRLMQPYMDGSAFPDRLPLPVWLAPVPPRRLRDTPTQLRQYMAACVEHFSEKGWVATPVFMHPAMVEPAGDEAKDQALQKEIANAMQLHLSRDMLAVTTPDATVSHARLWLVDDTDPRLPPAGQYATEDSVREWPWMCVARGIHGFVWRNALAGALDIRNNTEVIGPDGESRRPLLVAMNLPAPRNPKEKPPKNPPPPAPDPVYPTLRMAAVSHGLSDTALLGLLEKRSDPMIVNELLGGLVGRTGITTPVPIGGVLPTPPHGFLYAGWPTDRDVWSRVPAMLQKLILANDPGRPAQVSPDDPLYLATKLWLAQAHRPVARISGYRFNIANSPDGTLLDMGMILEPENPIGAPVETNSVLEALPGDLSATRSPLGTAAEDSPIAIIPAFGARRVTLNAAGHLDSLTERPSPAVVSVTEHTGGAILRFPAMIPVHRASPLESPPKIDGHGEDWHPLHAPTPGSLFADMLVSTRYQTRPELLAGTIRHDLSPATVRWAYDADNLYFFARCPQDAVSDQRTTAWPESAEGDRWWGTDGLQIQLASLATGNGTPGRILDVAFKPAGVMLVRTAEATGDGKPLHWSDAQPVVGIKYGITVERSDGRVHAYTVEAAIPRRWIDDPKANPNLPPAWRVNVLRHRATDLTNTSWSGPLISDSDTGLMGILIGVR